MLKFYEIKNNVYKMTSALLRYLQKQKDINNGNSAAFVVFSSDIWTKPQEIDQSLEPRMERDHVIMKNSTASSWSVTSIFTWQSPEWAKLWA